MLAAFAGAASMSIGYFGLLLGVFFAGFVYILLSFIVKIAGTNWIDKLMPPIIIGPTIAVIGLTLAPNAINNLMSGNVYDLSGAPVASPYLTMLCGLVTLVMTVLISRYSRRTLKLIPFIFGIISGYILALIFTIFGNSFDVDSLKIIDLSVFKNISWIPDFAFFNRVGFRNVQMLQRRRLQDVCRTRRFDAGCGVPRVLYDAILRRRRRAEHERRHSRSADGASCKFYARAYDFHVQTCKTHPKRSRRSKRAGG